MTRHAERLEVSNLISKVWSARDRLNVIYFDRPRTHAAHRTRTTPRFAVEHGGTHAAPSGVVSATCGRPANRRCPCRPRPLRMLFTWPHIGARSNAANHAHGRRPRSSRHARSVSTQPSQSERRLCGTSRPPPSGGITQATLVARPPHRRHIPISRLRIISCSWRRRRSSDLIVPNTIGRSARREASPAPRMGSRAHLGTRGTPHRCTALRPSLALTLSLVSFVPWPRSWLVGAEGRTKWGQLWGHGCA